MGRMLVLLLAACVDQAGPQTAANVPAQEAREKGEVRGRVLEAADTPLEGARVSTNNGIGTKSGDDGVYVLVLAPGEYDITATAAGFVPATVTVQVDGGMVYIRNWHLQRE